LKASKGAKKRADDVFSKLVRARGHCENCDSTRDLQCAHIISRRYAHTRTDLANAFCLCAKCHFRFTDWPLEFAGFVEQTIGLPAYEALAVQSMQRTKVDWEAEVARLKPILAMIEANQ
jgi:hypothetical protein